MKVSCKNCDKKFDKTPSQIKRTVNSFCCRSCAAIYNNKKFPKRKLKGTCKLCNKLISTAYKICVKCRGIKYKSDCNDVVSVKLNKSDGTIQKYKTFHHTKDKGDIGVACIVADLYKHGFKVAFTISEHLPFDIIAISPDCSSIYRVSVKYCSVRKNVIPVDLSGSWSDKNGSYKIFPKKDIVDIIAVYCPDTDKVYYIDIKNIPGYKISLRINNPKNYGGTHTIKMAEDYTNPRRCM